jgi:hypothetical protein
MRHSKVRLVLCAVPLFFLLLFSIGTSVRVGNKEILNLDYPKAIQQYMAIFRASGRLFWPLLYIAMLLIVVLFIKNMKPYGTLATVLILCCFVSVQCVDTYNSARVIEKKQAIDGVSRKPLISREDTKEVIDRFGDKKHIVSIDNMNGPATFAQRDYLYELGKIAMSSNMTLSNWYYARTPSQLWYFVNDEQEKVMNGTADFKDTLYIMSETSSTFYKYVTLYRSNPKLKVIRIGGYAIITCV